MPFETSSSWSPLPLMAWHLEQTPQRLQIIAQEEWVGQFSA
jgi:hypothetical protein